VFCGHARLAGALSRPRAPGSSLSAKAPNARSPVSDERQRKKMNRCSWQYGAKVVTHHEPALSFSASAQRAGHH
jgi:hypothetical protein